MKILTLDSEGIIDELATKERTWFGQTIVFPFNEENTVNVSITRLLREVQERINKDIGYFNIQEIMHGTLLSTAEKIIGDQKQGIDSGGYKTENELMEALEKNKTDLNGIQNYLSEFQYQLQFKFTDFVLDKRGNLMLVFKDSSYVVDEMDYNLYTIKKSLIEAYHAEAKNNMHKNSSGVMTFKDHMTATFAVVIGNFTSAKDVNEQRGKLLNILEQFEKQLNQQSFLVNHMELVTFRKRTLAVQDRISTNQIHLNPSRMIIRPTREIVNRYARLHREFLSNQSSATLTEGQRNASGSLKQYLQKTEQISDGCDVTVDCRNLNLSDLDLSFADFENINASGANFHNSYLAHASFKEAKLIKTKFTSLHYPENAREEDDQYDDGGYMQEYVIPKGCRNNYVQVIRNLREMDTIDFTDAVLDEADFSGHQCDWYPFNYANTSIRYSQLLAAQSIFRVKGLDVEVPDSSTGELLDKRLLARCKRT